MSCLDKILKEFPDINKEEVKLLEDALGRVKQRLIDKGNLIDIDSAVRLEARKMIQEIEITAKEAERNQMLISLKSQDVKEQRLEAVKAGFKEEEGLKAVTVGSRKSFKGSQSSADVLGHSIEAKLYKDWMVDINAYDSKMVKLFNNEKFNEYFLT